MVSAKDKAKLDELHQHFDPKCGGYEECELNEATIHVVNEDGVVDAVPVGAYPVDGSKDPLWVRWLSALTGCR